MSWKLWLDDQINDPDCPERHVPIYLLLDDELCDQINNLDHIDRQTPNEFIGAASSKEAMDLVLRLGPPEFMDLDHDLGGDDTAKVFLKWLQENYPNNPPAGWHVHSANNQAKPWIDSFMRSWYKSLE